MHKQTWRCHHVKPTRAPSGSLARKQAGPTLNDTDMTAQTPRPHVVRQRCGGIQQLLNSVKNPIEHSSGLSFCLQRPQMLVGDERIGEKAFRDPMAIVVQGRLAEVAQLLQDAKRLAQRVGGLPVGPAVFAHQIEHVPADRRRGELGVDEKVAPAPIDATFDIATQRLQDVAHMGIGDPARAQARTQRGADRLGARKFRRFGIIAGDRRVERCQQTQAFLVADEGVVSNPVSQAHKPAKRGDMRAQPCRKQPRHQGEIRIGSASHGRSPSGAAGRVWIDASV